jgi:hypothetical protein
MNKRISRRRFVEASLLASATIPLAIRAKAAGGSPADAAAANTPASQALPMGKIGKLEFSRLMMGGNLIGGYSHSRELSYVAALMRRYNTPAKIRETLEIGESQGITAINTWVGQDNAQIFEHWKAGGKMKWIAQARLDSDDGFSQFQKAIDQGASAVHITGDSAEMLLAQRRFELVGECVQFIKSRKCIAGVGAHDLRVIVECEKAKVDVDFYQKTFHSLDYYTAPRPDETDPVGRHDNSWCQDPQAVVDVMATIKKPWIAFKILAAGAIQPRAAFPYSFNSGADFILVGMFDWQIQEDAALVRRAMSVALGPNTKRTRAWYS